MNKRLFLACVFIIVGYCFASAQNVKKIEVEPYLGLTAPIRDVGYNARGTAGLNLGMEVRYNISASPISIGADINLATANRILKKDNGKHSDNVQRMASLSVVCDWNFRQSRNFSYFEKFNSKLRIQNAEFKIVLIQFSNKIQDSNLCDVSFNDLMRQI